jgi:hypothetical protein
MLDFWRIISAYKRGSQNLPTTNDRPSDSNHDVRNARCNSHRITVQLVPNHPAVHTGLPMRNSAAYVGLSNIEVVSYSPFSSISLRTVFHSTLRTYLPHLYHPSWLLPTETSSSKRSLAQQRRITRASSSYGRRSGNHWFVPVFWEHRLWCRGVVLT